MGTSTATVAMESDDSSGWILRILQAAMGLPGARVDRASFLRSQLRPHFLEEQVEEATGATSISRAACPAPARLSYAARPITHCCELTHSQSARGAALRLLLSQR